MSVYVHKTKQRLRVRSAFIRTNRQAVETLLEQLQQIEAVKHIKHQLHAGSVAITFDDKDISCEDLLGILESHGWLEQDQPRSFIENAAIVGTKTLVKGIAGIALSRLVGPSFSRVILNA
ncbi:HMA2 domain-containing protein [Shewanella pneumatophori]|uniref:HMA domain-containing protein n=1 Tax=Shewanella pneumatophori TaxID=314092 RepID=A0A9X1ZPD0_9GAMM|nr:hypothetical protein [Shewanella pneumatophori]MCL1139491.1 hypothetical protein [Shewanella pneumatophori]